MEKNDLLKELMQELNWYERILAKLFGNFIIKIYNISRIKIVNEMIKWWWKNIIWKNHIIFF